MNLENSLKKSDFILVEGDKKSGKLLFSINESIKENKEKILILSTYSKYILQKKLETFKNLKIDNLTTSISKIKILTLKENWPEIKSTYGLDFLLKDIIHAIEKYQPDTLILHRFDLFFDNHEINELKIFLEKIIKIKQQNSIKLFFTISNASNNLIKEIIENFSDINLEIKLKNNQRIIEVKHSIYPLKYITYDYLIKNNTIMLKPIIKKETEIIIKENNKHLKKKILIITKNKDLKNTLFYIFNNEFFEVEIAKNTSEIINKTLNNPDLIIYNPFDEEIDFNVCSTIKENKLKSKLIYITNQIYIRSEDKILGISQGCYEIFPYNFNIFEFISEIEKIFQLNFYTLKASKIKYFKFITNKNMFCAILEELYKEKMFFTFIKIISNYKIDINLLRQTDFVYQEDNKYYIILTHTRLINTENIIKKIINPNYEYKIQLITEAPESMNQKKEICK